MQKGLRFYARRAFWLICLFFICSMFYMASRHGPETNEIGLKDQDEMLIAEYKARQDWRKFRPADQQQNHNLVENRPGEQLSFQPQVPPNINSKSVRFSDLNIVRKVDKVLASKIRNYMVQLPHKLDEGGCMKNTTLAKYWLETHRRVVPVEDSWERFYAGISSCELYNDDRLVDKLLSDMSKLRIKHTAIMEGGTQVKLVLTFENDKQAVFKPMRFGRDYETDPNHFYFGDFERHNAEIATFHLDKILGYRRAVPTVGRVVNMTSELMEVAERRLRKTFFISPAKNRCFVSKCDYYCDTTHAICGSPDLKEGSVQVFLPDDTSVPRKHNKSPYRRTYSKKNQLADWQEDMDYCERKVKHMRQYAHGRRLLDLIDLHLMDYLIGNQDRHHYETFDVFGDIPAYAIHLDNGRSFGKTNFDDADILMPLRQCCLIKPKTLSTLFEYYTADKGLSETLHESLSKDPAFPILAFKHYTALERRLHKMMVYILECMDKQSDITNMVRNEFHNPSVPAPIPGENLESEDEDEDDTANQQNEVQPNQKQPAPPEQQQPDDKEEENARNVLKPPLRQKKDEVQMPAIIQPPPAA
uniref:FAM20 C-terminal domain-containing protein n=1 Tax=Meloidogyne enterolobii TaxID=390850 RepID=A0A6V7XFU4_MELEN|nr:unnamed protein product [Meloidogyne enterolobii]